MATMSKEEMREAIIGYYSSPSWTERVKTKMNDNQVYAIYSRLLRQDPKGLDNARKSVH